MRSGPAGDGAQAVFRPARTPRELRLYWLGIALLTAVGFGLRYQALTTGFAADDYAQLGMLDGTYLVPRSPLNLYNFSDGSVEETQRLLHGGFYPWWAHPQVRLSMLRPLASAMIWLDWQMFGNDAYAYHLHSLAWWLAMLGVIAFGFYRLLSVPVALLAFTFLVLDEAHGLPLAWIANRCALLSTTLALVALLSHLRYREHGSRRHQLLSLLCFTLAIGFGEYAICIAGYFAAYELLVARGPLFARLRQLWPVVVPTALYMLARAVLHHGPQFSGVYIDPFRNPIDFTLAFLQRLPVLYADLALGFRADWWTFGLPWTYPMVNEGMLPRSWLWTAEPWRRIHVGVGVLALILVWLLWRFTPRDERTHNVHWLFAGSVLSVLPVVASFPSSRLLLVALFGFTALLAAFVVSGFARVRAGWDGARGHSVACAVGFGVVALYHLTIPAYLAHDEVVGVHNAANAVRRAVLNIAVDEQRLPRQRMVVIAAVEGGTSLYIPLTRARHGKTVPKSCWTLSLTGAPHLLVRDTATSFMLSPMAGFAMLSNALEHMLRPPNLPLQPGDAVDVGGMKVTVMSISQRLRGLPKSIRVEFDVPLEDPSLVFVIPTQQGIQPYVLPSVGSSAIVPAPTVPP